MKSRIKSSTGDLKKNQKELLHMLNFPLLPETGFFSAVSSQPACEVTPSIVELTLSRPPSVVFAFNGRDLFSIFGGQRSSTSAATFPSSVLMRLAFLNLSVAALIQKKPCRSIRRLARKALKTASNIFAILLSFHLNSIAAPGVTEHRTSGWVQFPSTVRTVKAHFNNKHETE